MTVTPSPALNRAVLHTLGHATIFQGEPLADLWRALTRGIEEREARALPYSLGLVLPLLVGDLERVRLAADLAVAIDAYETAQALVQLLDDVPDSEVALAAAALASHPGVPRGVEEALRARRVVADLRPTLRRAFELRLDPAAPADDDRARLLRLQRWPGSDNGDYTQAPVAPVVALAEAGMTWTGVWRLVTRLRTHGAVVRRIPSELRSGPRPGWLGRAVPIVARSSGVLQELRRCGQDVSGDQVVVADLERLTDAAHVAEIVRSVDALLPHLGAPRLRDLGSLDVPTADAEVLHRRVFRLGSYTAGELAYLAGTSGTSIYRWSREVDALAPAQVEGMKYWGFNHLVALRFYYWLRSNVSKRVPRQVLGGLADYAGREEAGNVAVTPSGEVFVMEEEDDWYAIQSGQKALPDVLRVERAFEEFALGGGATVVPDLLRPTSDTRVHPAVLGGTPSLRRHRIACTAVAQLVDRHGRRAAERAYPFLSRSEVSQAVDVGLGILEAR